jgi:F-type H+-transporting ATPase subunit b
MLSIFTMGHFVCTVLLVVEAEKTTEQGLFSGTFADALWTVLTFVVLLIVLSKFAWKPMLERLKARELYIQQQIEAANKARQQAMDLLNEYKQQRLEMLKQAADEAKRQQQELLEKTNQKIRAIEREAQEDIKHAHARALEQLWNEAGAMILALSREVLRREISQDDNKHLILDAIEQIRQDSSNSIKQKMDTEQLL